MIKKIKENFVNKQFIIFIIIGFINTLIGSLFSIIFSIVFQANIAFVFGYMTGAIVSYILNSIFTFKETLSIKKYLSFFVSVIPNFIIQNLSVFLIYNVLKIDKIIAFVVAAVIGIPVTFIILKMFTFKKASKKYSKKQY